MEIPIFTYSWAGEIDMEGKLWISVKGMEAKWGPNLSLDDTFF